jgi:hypothetical protein
MSAPPETVSPYRTHRVQDLKPELIGRELVPQGGLQALDGDPEAVLVHQYDVVCNGVELSSGAIRNHRPDIMLRAFELAGYGPDEVEPLWRHAVSFQVWCAAARWARTWHRADADAARRRAESARSRRVSAQIKALKIC